MIKTSLKFIKAYRTNFAFEHFYQTQVRSLLLSFVKIAKPNRVKIYAYESSKLQRVFIKVVRWICQRLNGFFAKPSQILTKISQLVEAAASAVELV